MPRYIFMNLLRASEVTVTPVLARIRAILLTTALAVTGCISSQQSPQSSLTSHSPRSELVDVDIDNPIFIALVGLSAELQAWMASDPDSRSLQYIWETVVTRMKEMKIDPKNISVSLCAPLETERGFAYILIDVAGQQMQIFAKDKQTAVARTLEAQEFCIEYIRNRIEISLGWNPATQDKLKEILVNEEWVFLKHRMTAEIVQDNRKTWTISFAADAS